MKKRLLLTIACVASVLIHFGSFISLYFAPKPTHSSKPLEVTLVDSRNVKNSTSKNAKDQKLAQIVEQNKTVNDDIPKDAKYLSQFNQKVNKETKAAQTGAFQNTGGQGQAQQQAPAIARKQETESKRVQDQIETKTKKIKVAKNKTPEAESKQKTKASQSVGLTQSTDDTAPSAFEAFKPSYDWAKAARERDRKELAATASGGNGTAASQTNDYLPNQERGLQTMLNTREFMYYSYYNRIKRQLNQFWEPKIRDKVTDLFRRGRHIASDQDHITKLLIVLNAKGTLIGVKVLGPSGEVALDEAAVEAFQAAAPFPNPPKGIVESDGTIKIRWDFVLEV